MKRSEQRAKRALLIYCVAALPVLFVIYGQSMLSAESSGGFSAEIVAFLKSLIDPQDRIDMDAMHYFIRKAGHFLEYLALGICIGGAAVNLGRLRGRCYIALPLLAVMSVAVSDEFLQHFTGRGSAVTDVVLDFTGAACGLGVMALLGILGKQRRKKHETGLQ